MTDVKILEKKIAELENRLKVAEKKVALLTKDQEFMDALYVKAEELVKKHNRASAIFIQKHLMVDYPRATELLNRLKTNGVV